MNPKMFWSQNLTEITFGMKSQLIKEDTKNQEFPIVTARLKGTVFAP